MTLVVRSFVDFFFSSKPSHLSHLIFFFTFTGLVMNTIFSLPVACAPNSTLLAINTHVYGAGACNKACGMLWYCYGVRLIVLFKYEKQGKSAGEITNINRYTEPELQIQARKVVEKIKASSSIALLSIRLPRGAPRPVQQTQLADPQ